MRQQHGRTLACLVPLGVIAMLGGLSVMQPAGAQSSGSSIVEDALKDVEQDQQRDSERVRRMVDEAIKGTEQAPSGIEAVAPTAPPALQPVSPEEPGALPAGFKAEDLANRPVRDGTGAQIGTLRGMVRDEGSGLTRVLVEFGTLFGRPGKVSAVTVETLTPAPPETDGFVLELTPVAYDALPAYALSNGVWRRVDA